MKKIFEENKYKNVTDNSFNLLRTVKNGFKNGINTTWFLAKIIIPVYFIITIFKHTPLLNYISQLFAPVMTYIGLPGDAAVVLVLGNVVNLYAAIGAIASFTFTPKQITILAVMLSFSHSLFMESAVAKKTGVNVFIILLIRFSLAILSAIILNIII